VEKNKFRERLTSMEKSIKLIQGLVVISFGIIVSIGAVYVARNF